MQLKSLEVKGFKSFGDKVILHFDKGVTGIVGPNGCGKSNVVDAIRWVLGEQKTRMLRSEKMENVIFNGTKHRKASNLAEVTLTFDNTKNILSVDYNEIAITRKLYRTGESEYQINGVNCRLKDIHNLFLDTGIGSDSYAIMELRMIDEILNDKDNSRRQIFEEASGVSKYKIRKKEAISKLNDTQADLDRIDDILFEINKNLKLLQQQAKKSEKYFELKTLYKSLSVQQAHDTVAEIKLQIDNLNAQLHEKTDGLQLFESLITNIESEIIQLKTNLAGIEFTLQKAQKDLNTLALEVNQLENDKRFSSSKIDQLSLQIENLNQQQQNDQHQLTQNETKLQQTSLLIAAEQLKYKPLEADVIALESKNKLLNEEVLQLQNELHKARKSAEEAKNNTFKKASELSLLVQKQENYLTEKNKTESNMHDLSFNINDLQQQLNDNLAEQKQLNVTYTEHIDIQKGIESELEITYALLEQLKTQKASTDRKKDAKSNEYNLLKSLIDRMEGYPESLKFLVKQEDWVSKKILLSDVFTTSQQYKIAIESFLDHYLNYFVVNNVEEAQKAIAILTGAGKGKVGFWINSFFTSKYTPTYAIENATAAIDVVKVEVQHENLISYLLKDIYIIDDIYENELTNLSKTYPNAYFILTSGKLWINKNAIFGGASGLFEGKKIGRKQNLETIKLEIASIEKDAQLLDQQINANQLKISQLKAKDQKKTIQEIEIEINNIQKNHIKIDTLIAQFNVKQSESTERVSELSIFLNQIAEHIITLKEEVLNAETLLKNFENEALQFNVAYTEKNVALNAGIEMLNTTKIEFNKLINLITSLEKDKAFYTSQIEIIKQKSIDFDLKQKALQDEIAKEKALRFGNDENLVAKYALKQQYQTEVDALENKYIVEKDIINSKEDDVRTKRKEKDALSLTISGISSQINDLKLQQNSMLDRIRIEFDITEEAILTVPTNVSLDSKALKDELFKLKKKLDEYGPINPMALESYNEVKERFDFINEQKNDLLAAKATLEDTLKEIDATASEKFLTAFQNIRNNFISVFRSLFTEEDTCDLILSDLNNVLDAEIHIIAKPKGKKPLSINQLSGGEKTLTATALLFAIYLFKPAPFCIFDEVDAPLDDNNIDKFNNIIRRFSNNSQFIIVTHNKKTIATTDIIYGVTMLEQGVSKVVSVDLRSFNAN